MGQGRIEVSRSNCDCERMLPDCKKRTTGKTRPPKLQYRENCRPIPCGSGMVPSNFDVERFMLPKRHTTRTEAINERGLSVGWNECFFGGERTG
jgi:hypothetical protein